MNSSSGEKIDPPKWEKGVKPYAPLTEALKGLRDLLVKEQERLTGIVKEQEEEPHD